MVGAVIEASSELTTTRSPRPCRRKVASTGRATFAVPWMAVFTTCSNTSGGRSSTSP
ncbi:unannotated protein [freshwater metagenome]|uniref:Unannotated protein n=1 Tax=freshwater metagenome TaxID=449393 RepID=A0A6J7IYD0_9ZZZZ